MIASALHRGLPPPIAYHPKRLKASERCHIGQDTKKRSVFLFISPSVKRVWGLSPINNSHCRGNGRIKTTEGVIVQSSAWLPPARTQGQIEKTTPPPYGTTCHRAPPLTRGGRRGWADLGSRARAPALQHTGRGVRIVGAGGYGIRSYGGCENNPSSVICFANATFPPGGRLVRFARTTGGCAGESAQKAAVRYCTAARIVAS